MSIHITETMLREERMKSKVVMFVNISEIVDNHMKMK